MGFTSLSFWLFCAVLLGLYWLIQRKNWQNVLLLVASYIFYGWIHPWYAVLLGLSTIWDYYLARLMVKNQTRSRLYLILSLVFNLGVLAFFKYNRFFYDALLARFEIDPWLFSLALPAGLSFYTLKKLAYILDVSRGTLAPEEKFLNFALFVSFFPQIISGPIDRSQKLLPQFSHARQWKSEFLTSAWPLIVMGLFKKIVIADTMKSMIDRVLSLQEPSRLLVLAAALGFTLQILADFSAYTDIARGVARLFGIETTENFRTPYLSLTPSEFWNRWHITLSNFLRDYIFFPLRRALLRKKTLPVWLVNAVPPLVTMFVSGIWHGAGWTYLIWGLYYGFLIVAYQSVGIQGEWKLTGRLRRFLAMSLMFGLTVFGWLIFRAPSLSWLGKVFFVFPWFTTNEDFIIILVIISMIIAYSLPLLIKIWLDRVFTGSSWGHAIFYSFAVLTIIIYINSSNPDFIYFQF